MRHALVAATLLALPLTAPAAAEPKLGCTLQDFANFTTIPAQRACPTVQAGIVLRVVGDGQDHTCPANFLFLGSDGARYVGMDGYCVVSRYQPDGGTLVYPRGRGFAVTTTDKTRIGELRYATYRRGTWNTSFALARLDRGVRSNPAVRGWGGPTGVERRLTTAPEDVLLSGPFLHQEGKAALGFNDPVAFNAVLPAATSLGGPVLTADGKALGVGAAGSLDGTYVERLDPLVTNAAKLLKIKLTLLTAKFPA